MVPWHVSGKYPVPGTYISIHHILEEEIEGAQVVLELKEERIESLEKEIGSKRDGFRKEQSEAQKKLYDTIAENQKLQSETTDLHLRNSELRLEYYENVDKLTDKQKEIEVAKKEADKWMMFQPIFEGVKNMLYRCFKDHIAGVRKSG